MKRLCIDPGHGLLATSPRHFDPGAVHGGIREADITLGYARTLRLACEKAGIPTCVTRVTNEDPAPLLWRVSRAMSMGADVFLSIHCNAAVDPRAHGTETLYRQSHEFAIDMQRATLAALGLRDRGVKSRPALAVLRFPGPCALIELGFLSNVDDRTVMLSDAARSRFAAAVVDTITSKGWV